jgi:hypothetical protein
LPLDPNAREQLDWPVPSRRYRPTVAGVVSISAWALFAGGGCGPDDPPENPTWADVQPILRAECTGCHGGTAATTGSGYRFDFFDMTMNTCDDVADVLAGASLAHDQADKIARAITTTDPDVRPSMPPLPAPYLSDNEWLTILRWTANPAKGDKPSSNRPPQITLDGTAVLVDQMLDVRVIVTDPDGDPVVGKLKIGDQVIKLMDRSGAFSERFDTSSWPAGTVTMTARLCDGWSLVSADVLQVSINH